MNRAQRRALGNFGKPDPRVLDRIDRENEVRRELERNGITVKHLKENFDRGYSQGVKDSADLVTKASYAAAMLALRSVFGFGQKRILRFLAEMDDQLVHCIDRDDLIQEAYRQTGLRFQDNAVEERFIPNEEQ